MKYLWTLMLMAMCYWTHGQAVITAVFDGPLSGGTPKGVEIYLLEDVPDLTIMGISSANNGSGATGMPEFVFPAGSGSAGQYIYITSMGDNFMDFFGFAPDYLDDVANINGDDAIELFANGVVIDVFGDVDMDGSGMTWEYLDSWAARQPSTGPDGNTFVEANWTFGGVDALDGEMTNETAATPVPLKSYTGGMVTPDHVVEVRNNVFDPDLLIIDVGDIVEWNCIEGFHNVNGSEVTYPDNANFFDNGAPAQAPWTYQHTFDNPGYSAYQCDPHVGLGMVGAVMVRETGDHYVAVENNFFAPADITINLGETVVWTNVSGNHNVNGTQATFPNNPEEFSSGAPGFNWTYAHTFMTPGSYDYQCDPHVGLGMTGTITVLSPYRVVDMPTLKEIDADGIAQLQDSLIEISGTVYGPDYRGMGSGFEVFLLDEDLNQGVMIRTTQDIDNLPEVGPALSFTVRGRVNQFNGLLQVVPDFISNVEFPLPGGTSPIDPDVVDRPSEDTEGSFIRVNTLTLVDVAQWPGPDENANVQATNEAGDTVTIRIDRDINFDRAAPTGVFDARGLGTQFDQDQPFTSGYQLLLRSDSDIIESSATSDIQSVGISSVYPNPVSDVIHIDSDVMIERVMLRDFSGRIITQQSVYAHQARIPVQPQASGVHVLEVHTTTGVGVRQVIIE